MGVHKNGNEDQNDLNQIDANKGETNMEKSIIQQLMDEIDIYKQAIQDAKDALASAEMELDETLDMEYNNQ